MYSSSLHECETYKYNASAYKHKQLPGLVDEVKTSLYASTGRIWKGSFTGEKVQNSNIVLFQEV